MVLYMNQNFKPQNVPHFMDVPGSMDRITATRETTENQRYKEISVPPAACRLCSMHAKYRRHLAPLICRSTVA